MTAAPQSAQHRSTLDRGRAHVMDDSNNYRLASRIVLSLIGAGSILVAVWPATVSIALPGPVRWLPLAAHVAGMLAGYGVLVMMTVMSRWPVLDRGVGSDRLARWHSIGGRIVLSLIFIHAWAAVAAWAAMPGEDMPLALWHVLRMPWLISATIATAMLTAVAVVSIRAARRRIRYERWHAAHLSVYVAIALSFLHQLAGPDMAGRRPIQIGWALMYMYAFGLVLRYRVIAPFQEATRHQIRVEAVFTEVPGTVSIVMKGRNLDELKAESGQFFRWRFLTPDTWLTAHPFSLSAAPRPDRLRITVKAIGDGSRLLQSIDIGTWVIAEGPYGAMTSARRTHHNILLVAGGVGITPMRALFETLHLHPGDDMLLIYRARDPENLVFRAELDSIAASRGARVVYLTGPGRDQLSTWSLLNLVPDLRERDVYLCGPPAMADAVRASLTDAGLPAGQLHEERFTF